MKTFLILSSCFCMALCYPWGLPQPVHDTPEVAAAKSKHLAALAKAKSWSPSWEGQTHSWNGHNEDDGSWKDDTNEASWKETSDDGSWKENSDDGSWKHSDDNSWKQEEDNSWKHHDDGSWRDNTAKSWNHHYPAVSHYDNHEKKWAGPIAHSPGYDKHGAPLPVIDTPEVEAEKSKHFHLYAHAAAHAAPAHGSHGWESTSKHGSHY